MKTVKFRRRRECKTDYQARLALLRSDKPRFVVRKTDKYLIAQVVVTDHSQDKVVSGVNSSYLLEKGWSKEKKGSLKSLAAAYLIGFHIGNKTKDKFKELILDLGLYRNVKHSRVYAVVKGAKDAGLNVLCSNEVLPSLESIKQNKNASAFFDKVKQGL